MYYLSCLFPIWTGTALRWLGIPKNGWIKFIFQYIYYFVETALFTLILVYGQKPVKNGSAKYPIWRIILCPWGLLIFLSIIGLLSMLSGIAYGLIIVVTGT